MPPPITGGGNFQRGFHGTKKAGLRRDSDLTKSDPAARLF
jgi:hypothetical protein